MNTFGNPENNSVFNVPVDTTADTAVKNIFLSSLEALRSEDIVPKTSKKKKKIKAAEVIRWILFAVCAGIFLWCAVELFDIFSGYYRADDLYNEIASGFNEAGGVRRDTAKVLQMPGLNSELPLKTYSEQKASPELPNDPTAPVKTEKSIEFQRKLVYLEQLRDRNPDTYGYILIEGTKISYPVVQYKDNDYYLHHGFNQSSLNAGTIFVDFKNRKRVEDNRNIVVYGHNMLNGSMFHEIAKYDKKFPDKYGASYDGSVYGDDFFNAHRFISFITFDGIYTFEIISFYETVETDQYFSTEFASDHDFMQFGNRLVDKSQYQTEASLLPSDVLLTLSTCVNLKPDGRYACHAKLIKIEN